MDQQEKETITKGIHEILMKTFDKLNYIYQKNKEVYREKREGSNVDYPLTKNPRSRLVFPSYYDDNRQIKDTRISEQELRFAFVEAFNEYCNCKDGKNWFYSVETPTKDKYSGFSSKTPKRLGSNPRSAEFDMVIYDENELTCEIFEIKHSNQTDTNQYRHLINEDKCRETEFKYGDITSRIVLYNGEDTSIDNIQYKNVASYLKGLKTL